MNKIFLSLLIVLSFSAFAQETEMRASRDGLKTVAISEAAEHVDIVLEIEQMSCSPLHMYVAQRDVVSTSMAEKRTIFFEAFATDFRYEVPCLPSEMELMKVRSKVIRLDGVDNGYGTSVVILNLIVPANVKVFRLN